MLFRGAFFSLGVLSSLSSALPAEIAPKSPEKKQKFATYIVTGKVHGDRASQQNETDQERRKYDDLRTPLDQPARRAFSPSRRVIGQPLSDLSSS